MRAASGQFAFDACKSPPAPAEEGREGSDDSDYSILLAGIRESTHPTLLAFVEAEGLPAARSRKEDFSLRLALTPSYYLESSNVDYIRSSRRPWVLSYSTPARPLSNRLRRAGRAWTTAATAYLVPGHQQEQEQRCHAPRF